MLITNLIFFIASCIVLILSGSWLVKSLSKIARFLKLSEFIAAFIIMAFSTSVPELFVGITSAIEKNPALALGTVIGSNIAALTLVIGIAVILARGIKIRSKMVRQDATNMFFIALVPVLLMFFGRSIERWEGAILVAIFVFYIWRMIKRRKRFEREYKDGVKVKDIIISSLIFLGSLVLLYLSAQFLVKYATLLALDLALPAILIGLFLVAIGTSLPELVFQTRAVLTKHPEMALGDCIGSVVANSTLVLGITALIYPIEANFLLFFTSAIFMLVIVFLFGTMVESGDKLYLREGLSLIFLYIFFIMLEFYIHTLQGKEGILGF